MSEPHKHRDLIIAWANGATIQFKTPSSGWITIGGKQVIEWRDDHEYRIKPEPKPDLVQCYNVSSKEGIVLMGDREYLCRPYNLQLIFDGETGKLKSAEVV